jgi:hypothetical protein
MQRWFFFSNRPNKKLSKYNKLCMNLLWGLGLQPEQGRYIPAAKVSADSFLAI